MIRSTNSIIQGVGETSYRSQIRQNRKVGGTAEQFDQILKGAQTVAKVNEQPLGVPSAPQGISASNLFSEGLRVYQSFCMSAARSAKRAAQDIDGEPFDRDPIARLCRVL